MLNRSQLDNLLDELICPFEVSLIDYIMGSLDESRRNGIETHLRTCDRCQKVVEELKDAASYFDANESQVRANFEDRAAKEGLLPWYGFHIPDYLISAYLDGTIADDPRGRILIQEIDTHLKNCIPCQKKIQHLKSRIVIRLADLRQVVAQVQILQTVAFGVQKLAEARIQRAASLAAMAEKRVYRGSQDHQITAVVVDKNGNLSLDVNGKAHTVIFGVLSASIDSTGYLKIDLETENENYWRRNGSEYELEAALSYENIKVIFPYERINAQGRVTVVENLGTSMAVPDIPPELIHLRVRPRSLNSINKLGKTI